MNNLVVVQELNLWGENEMTKEKEVLLVEDNSKYSKPAIEGITSLGYNVIHTKDYVEARDKLNPELHAVITDVFFPYKTGSEDISVGRQFVRELAKQDKGKKKLINICGVTGLLDLLMNLEVIYMKNLIQD